MTLAGRFEEAIPISRFQARSDARLVVSPWSDHALEPYDPVIVNAVVEAACAAIGGVPSARVPPTRVRPTPPGRWILRWAGFLLAITGALLLALLLPPLPGRFAVMRGFLVAAVVLGTFAFAAGTWIGSIPPLRRLPQQLAITVLTWAIVAGGARLGIKRWHFILPFAGLTVACMLAGAMFPALFLYLTTLVIVQGNLLGWFAERNGTMGDGRIAMALSIGYAMGQWLPLMY